MFTRSAIFSRVRASRSPVSLVALLIAITFAAAHVPAASAQDNYVGWITIDGPMMEKPNPFAWLVGEKPDATLRGMLSKFDDAAERSDIKALMIHAKDLQVNTAQIYALREAMQRVRNAGKPVYFFSEAYGPAQLLLGCAADKMLIQQGGFLSFPGLYSEEMYLADTLKLVGLEADYVQVGDYKGASEPMARSAPSPEWDQNISALLDDMWAQMKSMVQHGRGFSDARFDQVLNAAWALDSDEAVELGLVDNEIDALELPSYVEGQMNGAKITTRIGRAGTESEFNPDNPFAILSLFMKKPDHTPKRDTIAVVHIDGPIVDGESQAAGLFGGESVGSRTVRGALKEIEDDDRIKGLIVRINSPGGSAVASEIIWQGVRRVAEHKPVFVSVGTMAASGGYYIAVSGDRIYVDPMSIVGSIGVVGGKIVMGGLYQKIDLGVTARARGPHAEMFGSLHEWTPEQREMVRSMMERTYDLFSKRVIQGRGAKIDMSKVAEGRLFTGQQAIENGMADGIADFDGVIHAMAVEVGLTEGQYDVMTYPGPMSFEDMLNDMFPFAMSAMSGRTGDASSQRNMLLQTGAALLREVIGDRNWPQVRDALNGLLTLRDEPVILMSPRVLVIH